MVCYVVSCGGFGICNSRISEIRFQCTRSPITPKTFIIAPNIFVVFFPPFYDHI
jgi:hypothetical protein